MCSAWKHRDRRAALRRLPAWRVGRPYAQGLVGAIVISADEAASLRHAAAVARVLIEQTERGWSHPAIDPVRLERAAQTLEQLANADGRVAVSPPYTTALNEALLAVKGTNPDGLDSTCSDLEAVAARVRVAVGLPGPLSRLSPLAD